MTESSTPDDRRAQHVALLGLILQLVFSVALGILAYSSESDAVAALARMVFVGLPMWLVLFLVFKQLRRVGTEALETAELKRAHAAGSGDALFELDDEALLLEQNRLRWMVRWLLPAVTLIVSAYLILGQFVGWGWTLDTVFDKDVLRRTQNPTIIMGFIVAIGFGCFLYARYAVALARLPQWRVIRGGATVMAGNALACLLVVIALMAASTMDWVEPMVAYLLRVTLVVLGIELAMNYVLDLYRPRAPGEIPRPSFDSRLLGLITEPGGIAKSIAEAVNYQFGFEVSKTWFYALLQRWLLPIVAVSVAAILGLTSIVVVDADEQVVVERFGRRLQTSEHALQPGIHFKLPFPIEVVYRAPVSRVSEIVIGEASSDEAHENAAVIWTKEHDYVPELMLLVASGNDRTLQDKEKQPTSHEHGDSAAGTASVPVSLLMVSVPIEYRIKNLHDYLYRYEDPVKIMEVIAYQFLSDYAASVDIDQLMGPGREAFNHRLAGLIQDRLDELQTGIEIVFVGLRGAHPPAKDKVADAFQGVIRAETQRDAMIHRAQGAARRILATVAGSETKAMELDRAIIKRNRLREQSPPDADALAAAEAEVRDRLLGNASRGIARLSGMAAASIANARAAATADVSDVATKVRLFSTELAAYQAAPDLYMERKKLAVYENLGSVRRFLLTGNMDEYDIVFNTQAEGALDRVLSEGVEKERGRGQ